MNLWLWRGEGRRGWRRRRGRGRIYPDHVHVTAEKMLDAGYEVVVAALAFSPFNK